MLLGVYKVAPAANPIALRLPAGFDIRAAAEGLFHFLPPLFLLRKEYDPPADGSNDDRVLSVSYKRRNCLSVSGGCVTFVIIVIRLRCCHFLLAAEGFRIEPSNNRRCQGCLLYIRHEDVAQQQSVLTATKFYIYI